MGIELNEYQKGADQNAGVPSNLSDEDKRVWRKKRYLSSTGSYQSNNIYEASDNRVEGDLDEAGHLIIYYGVRKALVESVAFYDAGEKFIQGELETLRLDECAKIRQLAGSYDNLSAHNVNFCHDNDALEVALTELVDSFASVCDSFLTLAVAKVVKEEVVTHEEKK